MQLRDVRVEDSSRASDRVRLCGLVQYETPPLQAEEYWFDVPRSHADELSATGNPWLACLLPLAATIGEPLRLPLPVDRPLVQNAQRLLRIWKTWYGELHVVPIEADTTGDQAGHADPTRSAAFFSGGVDSFFTVLRERETAPPAERTPIQDLITVWGFDIKLERGDAFERLRERHRRVAAELDLHLVDVATNLRATRWSEAQWSYLAHGAGLASIALALENRFHTTYIAGGGGYRGLHPWGSHSVTDPLFSTWRSSIVYDAVSYLRTEKIEAISGSPTALRALRVCYESWSDENCGECNKCRRTMLTLDVSGALRDCETFPRRTVDLDEIAAMDCSHFADFREFQDIREFAIARGRLDVVRALDRSMSRTRRRMRVRAGAAMIRSSLAPLVALVRR